MCPSRQPHYPLGSPRLDPAYKATKAQILLTREIHASNDAIRGFTSQLLAQTDWQAFAVADAGLKMRECEYVVQWARLEEVEEGRNVKNWMVRKETYLCGEDIGSGKMCGNAADAVTARHDGIDGREIEDVGQDREAKAREKHHRSWHRRATEQKRWQWEASRLMRDALECGVPLDLPRLRR